MATKANTKANRTAERKSNRSQAASRNKERQQAGLLAVEGEPDPSATPQQQDPPGFTEQLDPKPDHSEHFYRGCGKLKTALH